MDSWNDAWLVAAPAGRPAPGRGAEPEPNGGHGLRGLGRRRVGRRPLRHRRRLGRLLPRLFRFFLCCCCCFFCLFGNSAPNKRKWFRNSFREGVYYFIIILMSIIFN